MIGVEMFKKILDHGESGGRETTRTYNVEARKGIFKSAFRPASLFVVPFTDRCSVFPLDALWRRIAALEKHSLLQVRNNFLSMGKKGINK